jgi:hypothetical protein
MLSPSVLAMIFKSNLKVSYLSVTNLQLILDKVKSLCYNIQCRD